MLIQKLKQKLVSKLFLPNHEQILSTSVSQHYCFLQTDFVFCSTKQSDFFSSPTTTMCASMYTTACVRSGLTCSVDELMHGVMAHDRQKWSWIEIPKNSNIFSYPL